MYVQRHLKTDCPLQATKIADTNAMQMILDEIGLGTK